MTNTGKVYLVGAGPGDVELLTLKALRYIQECDWILYDRLVSEEIRELFPADTNCEYVGKQSGRTTNPQQSICDRLISLARQGHSVCRLKGGDPFIFGRGGEEMLALRNARIEVEITPAITAALGCGAAAGIPLTHRHLSQGITLLTGQAADILGHNWRALRQLNHTLVFYMGVEQAGAIQRQLLAAEMSPEMPVALIERGTLDGQRTIVGELQSMTTLISEHDIKTPAIIVVGAVVELAASTTPALRETIFEALVA